METNLVLPHLPKQKPRYREMDRSGSPTLPQPERLCFLRGSGGDRQLQAV